MPATIKQGNSVRLTIENGDETFAFDLDYVLGFGIFASGADMSMTDGDKYLALGVSATESVSAPAALDELLLRILDVILKAYVANGVSLPSVENRIRERLLVVAARHLRELDPSLTAGDAVKKLFDIMRSYDHTKKGEI